MVKNKKNLCLMKTLISFNHLKDGVSVKKGVIFSVFFTVLIGIIAAFKSSYVISSFNAIESFMYSIVSIPLILIGMFTLFFVFLQSFENNKKGFWESFLVFSVISIPFLVIGHLITLIQVMSNNTVYGILSILIVILIIYYLVNLTMNFKNYFKTTGYRVIASLILMNLIFGIFALIQYLTYLLKSLS